MEYSTRKTYTANVEGNATGLHWFNDDGCISVTTSDKKLMAQIRQLKKRSSEVVIDEDTGDYMLAIIPRDSLKIGIPLRREYTEEQKKKAAERLAKWRENNNK